MSEDLRVTDSGIFKLGNGDNQFSIVNGNELQCYLKTAPTPFELMRDKYKDHSVFKRIRAAMKSGAASIELYRPVGSTQSHKVTNELLEIARMAGMIVTARSSGNPSTMLYVISNLQEI